jgi:hypothetical protein
MWLLSRVERRRRVAKEITTRSGLNVILANLQTLGFALFVSARSGCQPPQQLTAEATGRVALCTA